MIYYQRAPLPKVGSVLHKLQGAGAQEYVKAEDYHQAVEERNALQAAVEWQADQLVRARADLLRCALVAIGACCLSFYLVVEGFKP